MQHLKEQQEFIFEAINHAPHLMKFLHKIFPEESYVYDKLLTMDRLKMAGLSDMDIFEAEMFCEELADLLEDYLPFPEDPKYDVFKDHEYYHTWKKVIDTISEKIIGDHIQL